MTDSDAPCQYCGEGAWGSSYVSDGKTQVRLCSDCSKQWELKLGYSHKFIVEKCPTCGHIKGVGIVKYTEKDGKKKCSLCGGWVDWLTRELCDDCASKTPTDVAFEEHCPECKRTDIDIIHGTTITGWQIRTKECRHCGWKKIEKLRKLEKVEPPEGVTPIFEVRA